MKVLLASILASLLLWPVNILGQAGNPAPQQAPAPASPPSPPPGPPKADPTQDQGVKKLSRREKREALRALEQRYRDFLADVEPIIMPTEENAFLVLETDAQRDLFIEDFWARRDPDTKSSVNEYREEYYNRLAIAKERFKYVSSERTRFFLIHGEPDEFIDISCDRYLQPLQIWIYAYLSGYGEKAMFIFYIPKLGSDYRLWAPIGGGATLDDRKLLLSRDGEMVGWERIFVGEVVGGMRLLPEIYNCKDADAILEAIAKSEMNKTEITRAFNAPKIDEEGVGKIFQHIVMADPNARKLSASVQTRFPGRRGGRTATEISITVPRSELAVKDLDGIRYYNVDVTGEILKDSKIFETFRYRFDYPADTATETIPMVVERFLRSADYAARIRVSDVNSNAQAIIETPLSVPWISDSAEQTAAKAEAEHALERVQEDVRPGESQLKIAPLRDDILTGLQQIEVLVSGSAVTTVEYYLDGKKVMSKRAPPYRLDVDFGDVPRTRNVRVVGLDKSGKVVAGDDLTLNTGADPFRVRIASPRVAPKASGPTRIAIEARAPEGKSIGKVEVFFNETKLATLYTPPWVTTIDIPAGQAIGYIRAVATLDNDPATPPAEDLVFVNTPEFMQNIQVHLIELPTTVLDGKGKLITGLEQPAFQILDNKKPVEIAKFEYVKDLTLSLGMAIDTSASMRPRMLEAQRAGFQFFRNILRPGDKAFVVAFDSQPQVVQKWSNSLANLSGGLAKLRAEEATSLYDAIIYSLYNFKEIKGQKALVVISDGKDTASKFTFDQALEYARRTAVPIYVVAIGIKTTEVDTRYKMGRLAAETGGDVYHIEKASDLEKVYDNIQTELRSQYLLGFYPPPDVEPGSNWREITVKVSKGKARTIAGYYP